MSSLKLGLDISFKTCYTESVRFVNEILPTFYWDAVHMVWKVF